MAEGQFLLMVVLSTLSILVVTRDLVPIMWWALWIPSPLQRTYKHVCPIWELSHESDTRSDSRMVLSSKSPRNLKARKSEFESCQSDSDFKLSLDRESHGMQLFVMLTCIASHRPVTGVVFGTSVQPCLPKAQRLLLLCSPEFTAHSSQDCCLALCLP